MSHVERQTLTEHERVATAAKPGANPRRPQEGDGKHPLASRGLFGIVADFTLLGLCGCGTASPSPGSTTPAAPPGAGTPTPEPSPQRTYAGDPLDRLKPTYILPYAHIKERLWSITPEQEKQFSDDLLAYEKTISEFTSTDNERAQGATLVTFMCAARDYGHEKNTVLKAAWSGFDTVSSAEKHVGKVIRKRWAFVIDRGTKFFCPQYYLG